MNSKLSQNPITGHVKLPWGVLIAGWVGAGFFVAWAGYVPTYSLLFLSISILMGCVLAISSAWLNINNSSLWAVFFRSMSLVSLFTIIAYRSIYYIVPKYPAVVSSILICSVIFTNTLSMWNQEIALAIKNELYVPKTFLGRVAFKASKILLPVGGVIGSIIFLLFREANNRLFYLSLILGPLCWLLALILPFTSKHPIAPWEHQRKRALKQNRF